MPSAACRWILGLKERVNAVCCMPLDPTRGLRENAWGLMHAARSYQRSEEESDWCLLHVARSYQRSEGESACCLLHAAGF
jgi:hypothetical protein